jgi:putative ABC transport system permease protein
MRIALKELLRQPGRFVPVGVALALLVMLLVVLGGFLDGLELSQAATTVGPVPASGETTDQEQIQDVIAFGYDQPTDQIPAPPCDRGAVVDATLADLIGIGPGAQLALGPGAEQITVSHIVDDLTQGAPTIWLATADWRSVIGASDPTALPPQQTAQALVVTPADDGQTGLADRIGRQVDGVAVATPEQVIGALEVVQSQSQLQGHHRCHVRRHPVGGGVVLRPDHVGTGGAVRRAEGPRGPHQ